MSKEPTYAEAFTELQQIVNEIETGDVSVDILALKVKRAVQLIRICKLKLSSTEEEVNLILKELEDQDRA
ncbi:MAG TPA: exodeoxyribonuclease VII small subunit [Bacteroidales bacterium]|nr:exodeoxyribonuclease VII small subunit [Bacteroidales bacterium]